MEEVRSRAASLAAGRSRWAFGGSEAGARAPRRLGGRHHGTRAGARFEGEDAAGAVEGAANPNAKGDGYGAGDEGERGPLETLGRRVKDSFATAVSPPPAFAQSADTPPPPLLNWDNEELKVKEGLGFGFSAGGLLFPYFVGNAVALKRLGLIDDSTVFAGSSAGSLISACIVCGLDEEELMSKLLQMYRELRAKGIGTIGNVRSVTEEYANLVLPEDAHLRSSGRLNVSIVRINRQRPFLESVFVNEFHSREDLIQALLTSSHVPLYMNTKVTSEFRGRTCVDGGLGVNFIPVPPCTQPVQVCCFPIGEVYQADIAPGKFSECAYSLATLLKWAVLPPTEENVLNLFEMGVSDVLDWASAQNSL